MPFRFEANHWARRFKWIQMIGTCSLPCPLDRISQRIQYTHPSQCARIARLESMTWKSQKCNLSPAINSIGSCQRECAILRAANCWRDQTIRFCSWKMTNPVKMNAFTVYRASDSAGDYCFLQQFWSMIDERASSLFNISFFNLINEQTEILPRMPWAHRSAHGEHLFTMWL